VKRDDFDGPRGYLNTASVGIPPRVAVDAMRDALGAWSRGEVQPPEYDPWVERGRASFARLHGTPEARVSIGPQVSYFVGIAAAGLRPGAQVVAYEDDFTSLLWPFMARARTSSRSARCSPPTGASRTSARSPAQRASTRR
jgi:hypothetical protein